MVRKQLLAQFDAATQKTGLAEYRDRLLADTRECVHLHYGKSAKRLPLGASRIGGTPDLPRTVAWPDGLHEGKPSGKAEFLAQVNLADLPAVDDVGSRARGTSGSSCETPPSATFRSQ